MPDFDVKTYSGKKILPLVEDLAHLRIVVFRDFPYIYDGSIEYEREYLQTYINSPRSLLVTIRDKSTGKVVGCSTALPLTDETEEFKKPFREAGYNLDKIFYFGESVLLAAYRGHGLGHRFFDEREAHASRYGDYTLTTFCAVDRPQDHPLRPVDYRPLDGFWQKRGYQKQEKLISHFTWQDVDQKMETEKPLTFWTRALP